MTVRNPLVRVSGKIIDLPTGDTIAGAPAGADGAAGGVTTITNADGSLTIAPTSGNAVASLNVSNFNTWAASIKLRPGATGANTAPLYWQSGNLLSAAVVGAAEFLTDKWYGTITTGTARKEFALADIALTAGRVPFNTTNGRLTDSANLAYTSGTGLLVTDNVKLTTAGNGIYVKEGTNATQGVATLVAGTVTVATTKVTANSRVHLTVQALGTVAAAKAIAVTARVAATSFTITSADATDTSIVAWLIVEPA